jgi:hypothetical protein
MAVMMEKVILCIRKAPAEETFLSVCRRVYNERLQSLQRALRPKKFQTFYFFLQVRPDQAHSKGYFPVPRTAKDGLTG